MLSEAVAPTDWKTSGRDEMVSRRIGAAEAHAILRQQMQQLAPSGDLLPADTQYMTRQTSIRTYAPGEIVLRAGARADCLGLLVEGQAAVYHGWQGGSQRAATLLPGHTFGQEMLVGGRASTMTLQAISRCEVWFVRRADLGPLVEEHYLEWQAEPLWYRLSEGVLWLTVALAVILALGLPSTRQALALVPMGLGQWCEQQEQEFCAARAWMLAAILSPRDTDLRLALGTYYAEQGQLEAAKRVLAAAQLWAPDSPQVQNNLGFLYAKQGEHERAVSSFWQALELGPGVSVVEQNLGLSLQALHSYDEALAHYQSAAALGSPPASTLVNMAIAYYESGQLVKAEDAARTALAFDGVQVPAYTVLGAVALESRQPEVALTDLRQAVGLDPSYGPAQIYLGLTYEALGRPVEAIAALEQALVATEDAGLRARIRLRLSELLGNSQTDGEKDTDPVGSN